MKNTRLINIVVSVISAIALGGICLFNTIETKSLKYEYATLKNTYANIRNQTVALKNESTSKVTEVEKSVQGVAKTQLEADSKTALDFFKAAFQWDSGSKYNKIRANYIDKLGADNSFITNFLTENATVEVSDPDIPNNYIDLHDLKSEYSDIKLYPMTWKADGTITYTAVVTYYLYTTNGDTDDKEGLIASKAILQFTLSGSTAKDRTVSDVSAYSGSIN